MSKASLTGVVAACGVALGAAAGGAAAAGPFDVSIFVSLDGHEYMNDAGETLGGTYGLVGQSAFLQTRTGGLTSGGQLDGVETGLTGIGFGEVFPPASLADFLGFAYFGVGERRDADGGLLSRGLVVAVQSGFGGGSVLGDLLGGLAMDDTGGSLADALAAGFDTPEFFRVFDAVLNAGSLTEGVQGAAQLGRAGDELDLVYFEGSEDGVVIGSLSSSVVEVPGPGAAAVLGAAGVAAARRRRR